MNPGHGKSSPKKRPEPQAEPRASTSVSLDLPGPIISPFSSCADNQGGAATGRATRTAAGSARVPGQQPQVPTPGPRQAGPSRTMRPGRRKNTPKKRPQPQAEPRASTSASLNSPGPRVSRVSPGAGPSTRHGRRNQHILREIRKLQRSTDLLIGRAPFGRLVREICLRYTRGVDFYWQAQALLALQELPKRILSCISQEAE
ncbi:histone H3-like centromeric protein A isoform X2 [Macrotis lagotis]|uniref:histone H3-like centromeric protein A isoform X2 n=1 Tax=Macrotis lagotis TaxID=92651 RepID=UPI003D69F83F